ncbi:MAG: hypothetical protein E6J88_18005 [Deltaproteobacteria bacterium]|nr:MAG: hypothetical protein E6J88_18005 [Deltaproteobacteria bacterium]
MITCCIRYVIAPGKTAEFEEYGRRWIELIAKYGGTHHGYFLPDPQPELDTSFSFPGLGAAGAKDVAIALYSFSNASPATNERSSGASSTIATWRTGLWRWWAGRSTSLPRRIPSATASSSSRTERSPRPAARRCRRIPKWSIARG